MTKNSQKNLPKPKTKKTITTGTGNACQTTKLYFAKKILKTE